MIPILYESTETEFYSNGIGRLIDCVSCIVTEERNGIYECEFQYPVTGRHFSDIKEGRIIAVIHDDLKDIQPFDIYKHSAPIDGIVTFNAHHISYRLGNVIIRPFTAASCAGAIGAIPANTVNENPFTFWTDKAVIGDFALTQPKPCREILGGTEGSILDIYGKGEYKFDKWMVRLYLNRGDDNGVEIRYRKNMSDITHEVDTTETYNAVVPFWTNGEETVWLPEYVVLPSTLPATLVNLTTDEGYIIDTEDGEPIEVPYAKVMPSMMDLTDEYEEAPTEEQMRARAQAALDAEPWVPDESIDVDFIALWQTEEYQNVAPLQRVGLCDTVTVIFDEIGVNAKMKVISVEYDVLLERFASMKLGSAKSSFAEVVMVSTESAIMRKVVSRGFLKAAVENATRLITGAAGGHVKLNLNADGEPFELLIMDTDNVNTAQSIWRWNMNGWGYSSNGYQGPYTTAATLDGGFVADFITTGNLNANLLKVGRIEDALHKSWWDLESGEIHIDFTPPSGEGGDVTREEFDAYKHTVDGQMSDTLDSAKGYADDLLAGSLESGGDVAEYVRGRIDANNQGLETQYVKTTAALSETKTYYYMSASPTSYIGGKWVKEPPEWTEGKYLWMRNDYVKADGTTVPGIPFCASGSRGATGAQGPAGPQGETGATGAQGPKGDTGAAGAQGPQGVKGDKGDTGATGAQGPKGDKGATGAQGPQGVQGPKGETGATGATGAKGDKGEKGDTGPQGPQGAQGVKGDKGETGAKGDRGEKGDDGSPAYNLYITSDSATTTPKETAKTVTLTAHVGQGDNADIDPLGTQLVYLWYVAKDNGAETFVKRGKTYTVTIDGSFCEDAAAVWFVMANVSSLRLTDHNGTEITTHTGATIEVA